MTIGNSLSKLVIMIRFTTLFFLIISTNLFADVYRDKFDEVIKGIKSLDNTDYIERVTKLKKQVNTLLEQKRGICSGEFGQSIFEKGDSLAREYNALTAVQKEECYLEVKKDLASFYRTLYLKRKSYLVYAHHLQLKKLEKDYDDLAKANQAEISALEKKLKKLKKN